MTAVAGSQMANLHGHAGALIILVIFILVVFLPLAERWFGDAVPMLIFFAVGAFDLFIVPRFPGSPIACLINDNCTKDRTTWLAVLLFLVPLCLCVLYKEIRGDGRGTKGGRLP